MSTETITCVLMPTGSSAFRSVDISDSLTTRFGSDPKPQSSDDEGQQANPKFDTYGSDQNETYSHLVEWMQKIGNSGFHIAFGFSAAILAAFCAAFSRACPDSSNIR